MRGWRWANSLASCFHFFLEVRSFNAWLPLIYCVLLTVLFFEGGWVEWYYNKKSSLQWNQIVYNLCTCSFVDEYAGESHSKMSWKMTNCKYESNTVHSCIFRKISIKSLEAYPKLEKRLCEWLNDNFMLLSLEFHLTVETRVNKEGSKLRL